MVEVSWHLRDNLAVTERTYTNLYHWREAGFEDSKEMDTHKTTILAIKSCKRFDYRAKSCMNTWVKDLDNQRFFPIILSGDSDLKTEHELINNNLYLKCGDMYEDNTSKIIKFFNWVINKTNASYVWICDDDSYINTKIFNKYEKYYDYDYLGQFAWGLEINEDNKQSGFAAGCGYCLSRKSIEICSQKMMQTGFSEDLFVGHCLYYNFPSIRKYHETSIYPWSKRNYIKDLMIGHYINLRDRKSGARSDIETFEQDMNLVHSYYNT
jgi:hypothetical protein